MTKDVAEVPDGEGEVAGPTGCVFCRIVRGDVELPAAFERRGASGSGVVVFRPLGPVTEGHLLVVPTRHVPDAAQDPGAAAEVMYHAAQIAAERGGAHNLITSIGAEATQTVAHLHAHVVPRRAGDGLVLPWTGGGAP